MSHDKALYKYGYFTILYFTKGVQPVPKAVYRSAFRDKLNCPP